MAITPSSAVVATSAIGFLCARKNRTSLEIPELKDDEPIRRYTNHVRNNSMKLTAWLAKHMMQWLLIFDIDIMAKTILIAEKQEAKINKIGHIRVWGGRKR